MDAERVGYQRIMKIEGVHGPVPQMYLLFALHIIFASHILISKTRTSQPIFEFHEAHHKNELKHPFAVQPHPEPYL